MIVTAARFNNLGVIALTTSNSNWPNIGSGARSISTLAAPRLIFFLAKTYAARGDRVPMPAPKSIPLLP